MEMRRFEVLSGTVVLHEFLYARTDGTHGFVVELDGAQYFMRDSPVVDDEVPVLELEAK